MVDEIDRQYKTLGRDIEIQRRDQAQNKYHNPRKSELDGRWDRSWEKGDFVQAKGNQAVYNAITLSILTAKNELENKGLPTYKGFGNRSYELLKENKNRMTLYKIESYFTDAINRIRRIREVLELNINEYDVHSFDINFTAATINDTIISGNLNYDKNKQLSHSFMSVDITPDNPIQPCGSCKLTVKLSNIRGSGLPDRTIRLYLDDTSYSYGVTDDNGEYEFIISNSDLLETKIYLVNIVFEGDNDFYPVEMRNLKIISTQYRFLIQEGILRMQYNPDANIPSFKVENGKLWVDRETNNDEYKIDNDFLFINL